MSTKQEEQEGSFQSQYEKFKDVIRANPDWINAGIYKDYGKSGTDISCRPGFLSMMEAARKGEFDIILTKSISRFSRNVVDLLSAIRELRTLGIEVRFDTPQITSFDPKYEIYISIFAGLAQEESKNLSENIKWGITRKMEKGEFTLPYARFLGYKKGKNGKPEIVKREARTVREIYQLFLSGRNINRVHVTLTI